MPDDCAVADAVEFQVREDKTETIDVTFTVRYQLLRTSTPDQMLLSAYAAWIRRFAAQAVGYLPITPQLRTMMDSSIQRHAETRARALAEDEFDF